MGVRWEMTVVELWVLFDGGCCCEVGGGGVVGDGRCGWGVVWVGVGWGGVW